ncbi:hypothetical protein DZF91_16440 [Actinomadura logoneensis]|uniref:Uncharacterized protein n=1 Tax=Actinomadura logoneensis TaxID=2293572 RepID=A0A372JL30_9ACTN|nr:hypothetical protein DZF91_16440 [Actinomadura logoneensis]
MLAGVLAIPALGALLIFGAHRINRQQSVIARTYRDGSVTDGLLVLGLLVATGLLVALLCGSRLSPLASLIAGAPLLGVGAFSAVRPVQALAKLDDLPGGKGQYGMDAAFLARSGIVLLVGAVLFLASFPPSRWRGRARGDSLPFSEAAGDRPAAEAWSPPPGMPMVSGHEAPPLFDGQAAPSHAHEPGGRPGGGRPGPAEPRGGEWTQAFGGEGR